MSEENMKQKIRLLVVLGSGGHTTEMINIVKNLDEEKYGPKTYLYSSTDIMSKSKAESLLNQDDVRISIFKNILYFNKVVEDLILKNIKMRLQIIFESI